jgi:acetylglutamate kinase
LNDTIPVSLEIEHKHLKDDPPLNEAIPVSLEVKHHHLENDRALADIVQETIHFVESLKGKKFVVKLGGSTLEHQRAVLQDIIWLHALGANIALVHGGGPYITEWLQKLNIPTRFEHGLRVTDAQTLEVVRMVLCGQINQALVAMTTQLGGKAVGLSGSDGNMVRCHKANEHLGFVGEIETVDPMLVQQVLDDGFIPIIAPVGLAPDGTCLNMNADLVASQLAGALKADRLIFLSNVDGIRSADGLLIPELNKVQAHKLIDEGVICDGMIPKVTACLDALVNVPCVHIVNGSTSHVLLYELEDNRPIGTKIVC